MYFKRYYNHTYYTTYRGLIQYKDAILYITSLGNPIVEIRPSYDHLIPHNGISYSGQTSLHWLGPRPCYLGWMTSLPRLQTWLGNFRWVLSYSPGTSDVYMFVLTGLIWNFPPSLTARLEILRKDLTTRLLIYSVCHMIILISFAQQVYFIGP